MTKSRVDLFYILSNLLAGLYFFSILIWPEYIKYSPLNSIPGLTANRLLFIIIFPFVLFRIIERFKYLNRNQTVIIVFLLALSFFVLLLISTLVSDYESASIKTTFFVLENTFIFGFILYLFYDDRSKNYFLKVLLLAISTVVLIGFLEWIYERNILESLLISSNEAIDAIVKGQARNGHHRVSSTYLNPLSCAVHLLAFIPILFVFLDRMKGTLKILVLINIFLIPILIFGTDSRVAIVFCLFLYSYFVIFRIYNKSKFFFAFSILIGYLTIVFLLLYDFETFSLSDIIQNQFVAGQNRENSIIERIEQYGKVANEVFSSVKSFLIGSGFGSANEIVYPLSAVDNFYLSIILEGGVFTFFMLIFMFYSIAKIGFQREFSPLSKSFLMSLFVIYFYFLISASLEILSFVFMLFVFIVHEKRKNFKTTHQGEAQTC